MSGTQPFQFKPTYPPGEEPVDSEKETMETAELILITELETPNGAFVGAIVFQFRRPMNVFVVKN